jgi:hypothetical protein
MHRNYHFSHSHVPSAKQKAAEQKARIDGATRKAAFKYASR